MAPENEAHCMALVREADRDRFLATLFAPAIHRPHLYALYAFNAEVARVRDVAREPMAGEIRLQWWREVLEGERAGEAAAHPVAAALLDTIAARRLPRAAMVALIEARMFDLYDDPMPSVADLEGYCGETSSALIRLAAIILADGQEPGGAEAAGHGGVAAGIVHLLRALPLHARRGQCPLPADLLARHGAGREDLLARRDTPGLRAVLSEMRALARRHLARTRAHSLTPALLPAFLPLALLEGYLARMERPGFASLDEVAEVPQWRRQWRLWRAARLGRI